MIQRIKQKTKKNICYAKNHLQLQVSAKILKTFIIQPNSVRKGKELIDI